MTEKKKLSALRDDLTFVIQNQITNMKLIQAINTEFESKGFEIEIPNMLFNKQTQVETLNDNELLALSKATNTFLINSNLELKVDVNPENYFQDAFISEYTFVEARKEKINRTVVFNECREIKEGKDYWVYLTPQELLDLRLNRNIQYFEGIQRASKIETLPNGMKIKKINVNKEGIKEIAKRFKKHNIRPTSIALALLTFEGKDPKVQFIPEYKHTGRLSIEVDFDRSHDSYAPLIIPDGKHRWDAICDAKLEDKNVTDGLGVFVHFMTEKEAKQYVADVFQRNETSEEYIETLKDTSDNRFVDNIVNNSEILRNDIANTFTEYKKMKDKLTYRTVLSNCAKYTEIELSDEIKLARKSIQIAKIIDILIKYISSTYFENNIEKMKEHPFLLKSNMFVGYIAIANVLKDKENYSILAGDIADRLIKINEDLNKQLKLDVSECEVEKIYKYFEELAKEVI